MDRRTLAYILGLGAFSFLSIWIGRSLTAQDPPPAPPPSFDQYPRAISSKPKLRAQVSSTAPGRIHFRVTAETGNRYKPVEATIHVKAMALNEEGVYVDVWQKEYTEAPNRFVVPKGEIHRKILEQTLPFQPGSYKVQLSLLDVNARPMLYSDGRPVHADPFRNRVMSMSTYPVTVR